MWIICLAEEAQGMSSFILSEKIIKENHRILSTANLFSALRVEQNDCLINGIYILTTYLAEELFISIYLKPW